MKQSWGDRERGATKTYKLKSPKAYAFYHLDIAEKCLSGSPLTVITDRACNPLQTRPVVQ